jgi:genome maintenance exonuclease 1
MAHNYVYGTKIQQGVILMCSKDKLFQRFEISDKEFVGCQHAFLKKVDQYYRDKKDHPNGKDTKNEQKTH